ncbi:MAG: phosphatidate cytidylyltransferase [Actinomycetota bacterium]|nr:phosphatidate cytidylyltransferase [Actinomycetota bacterium]
MSRHDDDGGNRSASDDGDDKRGDDEPTPEDEFRDWVGEAAVGPAPIEDAEKTRRGWLGRVFGPGQEAAPSDQVAGDESPDSPDDDPRPSGGPDSLSVFSAVVVGDDAGPTADGLEEPEGRTEEVVPDVAAQAASEVVDKDPEHEAARQAGRQEVTSIEGSPAPVTDLPPRDSDEPPGSFADLWGAGDGGDDEEGFDDFPEFTSEDYLEATTREYAGLAEDVARAAEEATQPIAVSAEIPGLESGVVGLEDVVAATGGDVSTDVIAPPATSDLSLRVLTAVGLLIVFGASLLSPFGIGALIVVVLGIAAGELFAALIRSGYRPLSLFGFLGIAGAFFGTWASGPVAIPIALLLTAIAVFLFYATAPGRRAVLENATLTIMVTAWIGGLGGFAFDFLGSPHYRWLVLALVVIIAVMDVAQYFVGRRLGRHPLAPHISPKKTVEGYLGGVVVALGVGAAFSWAEPFELTDGLILGGVAAVVGPIGDLAVSIIKRSLGVKDMGYILPGHGGVLDRVDAMILTIPAFWIVYSWMGLLS